MEAFLYYSGCLIFSYLHIRILLLCVWAHQSKHWPKTSGKIIFSGIEWTSDDIFRKADGTSWQDSPRIDVRYVFEVNKKEFKSKRVNFHLFTGHDFFRNIKKYINRYTAEQKIEVFYNPRDPRVSCLEPGMHWTNTAIFVLFSIFLIGFIVQEFPFMGDKVGIYGFAP